LRFLDYNLLVVNWTINETFSQTGHTPAGVHTAAPWPAGPEGRHPYPALCHGAAHKTLGALPGPASVLRRHSFRGAAPASPATKAQGLPGHVIRRALTCAWTCSAWFGCCRHEQNNMPQFGLDASTRQNNMPHVPGRALLGLDAKRDLVQCQKRPSTVSKET
jgi:hypothetical protein